MSRLTKFLARSRAERALLIEAAIWLAVSRAAIVVLPFRWIAPRLGQHMTRHPDDHLEVDEELLRRISWAVTRAADHLPFAALCLPQAMAAKAMLRRRGIASTLYLGLRRDDALTAHAWLSAGGRIITGGPAIGQFTVVSTFA